MPITASVLRTLKKPLQFAYLGETVNISYYPSALGDEASKAAQALMQELQAAQATNDEARLQGALIDVGAWIASFLASWDYLQDDGVTPQPITAENLATQLLTFPDFIQAVITTIMTDRNQGNAPGTPTSESSAATSSAMALSPMVVIDAAPSALIAASPTPSASSLLPDGSEAPLPSDGS